MHKPSTLLYHDHIINNIQFLDKRKDGYVGHRLEFIHQQCIPVKKRIQAIKDDIKFYENMRDTQYEVIQGQSDIMQLKKQIADYTQTNHYYQQKLDQFDKFIAQLQVNLKQRKKIFADKKYNHKTIHFENGGSLSTIRSRSHIKNKQSISQLNRSIAERMDDRYYYGKDTTSNYGKDSLQASRSKVNTTGILDNISENDHQLPMIQSKKSKYSQLTTQQKQMQRHLRNQHRLQKIINRQQNHNISLQNSIITNPQSQLIKLTTDSINEIKQAIIKFDHTESLFRECFERKKLSIQKSVSQLQSKLITNKETFLKACEVIGQKNGTLSFEDFCQLTTDQITTLFISFSWLSRKVYSQFAAKRKDIMQILKIIKSVQQK